MSGLHVDFDAEDSDIGFLDDLFDDVIMHPSVTGCVDWVGMGMLDEFDSVGSVSDDEGKPSCCEFVEFEIVEEEHELLVALSKEVVYVSELTQHGRLASLVEP